MEKYGAVILIPQGTCQIGKVVKNVNGMTANMVCTGSINGMATVQSSSVDLEHAIGVIYFTGTMQIGATSKAVEWTITSTSTYRSPDCGNVKPASLSDK